MFFQIGIYKIKERKMGNKTTKTRTSAFSWSKIFKLISFWAVIVIAVALIFSQIIRIGGIGSALQKIGNIMAYIVVLASSLSYVCYKRNVWYFVSWFVALILIVVFVILMV